MKEFVPVSDEVLDTAPELFNRLIPYQTDYPCRREYTYACEITPADLQVQIPTGDFNRADQHRHHHNEDE